MAFLKSLFLLCLVLLSVTTLQAADKPNIILIMADDLGYADVGCFGSKRFRTPNIDALALQGVRLTDYHSNGAVCSPTRAALLTGRYQQRCGITGVVTAKGHRHTGLDMNEITFAEVMKKAGYVTAIFGKWHLGYKTDYNPYRQGFDEFRGYVSGNVDYHGHIDQEGHEDWWRNDKLEPDTGYSTDLITDYAVDFIKRNKDKPFLLYLPHEAPHYPFQGRKDPQQYQSGKGIRGAKTLNKEESIRAYKEMIEVMDEGIGRVMKTVKDLNLEKNTVIIFCSDNGPSRLGLAKPLKGRKGSIYEGGHRVPAVVCWPGVIKPGTVSDETCAGIDLFPTMVAIAKAEIPTDLKLDGVSIMPMMLGQRIEPRSLFWGIKNEIAIRKGAWKLIASKARGDKGKVTKYRLYNLRDDIGESKNVASQYPQLVKELLDELKAWDHEVNKNVEKRT